MLKELMEHAHELRAKTLLINDEPMPFDGKDNEAFFDACAISIKARGIHYFETEAWRFPTYVVMQLPQALKYIATCALPFTVDEMKKILNKHFKQDSAFKTILKKEAR